MFKFDARKLYSFLNARWYDPFKDAWNRFAMAKAEEDVRSFMKDHFEPHKSVLELGCGTGKNMESVQGLNLPFESYLGVDFTPAMLEHAVKKFNPDSRIEFRQGDIRDLSDLDEKYDIIICTWVMSHMESPSDVINKAQALLKENGVFYLVFMTRPDWIVNFWFWPFAILFKSRYVTEREIEKIKNISSVKRYSRNLGMSVLIKGKTENEDEGNLNEALKNTRL